VIRELHGAVRGTWLFS